MNFQHSTLRRSVYQNWQRLPVSETNKPSYAKDTGLLPMFKSGNALPVLKNMLKSNGALSAFL